MNTTATIEISAAVARPTGEEARAVTGPPTELIISPFPGLVHVVQVDSETLNSFHWTQAVPFVVAMLCVMALLAFGTVVVT